MWGLEALGIQYNEATGIVGLPVWAAAVAAALLVVFFVLALVRTGLAGTLMFLALVGFAGWAAFSWTEHNRVEERRGLQARLLATETVAQAPNSPLSCLAGTSGDALETACERSLFASAESAAAATSYAARQVSLLGDALRFASASNDTAFAKIFDPLRVTLEQDRYGAVANALTTRYGCSPDVCVAFANFKDTVRLRANMRDNAFAGHVQRASASWGEKEKVASTPAPAPNTMATRPGAPGTPLPDGYNLPSASSIPPVSIMAAEPTTPPPAATPPRPAAAQPQQPRRTTPPPPRRPADAARPSPPPGTPGSPNGSASNGLPPPPRAQ
ncbi:hypothetical protein GJW-30_1_03361 [Variibacter gotjawalensis]|uniref:Uncharacterized protein n=1 Tax=Variibacter gotjawalensis TaxID=1333996 RepID=A0A0S3PY33_9BRAD|nr:hypothetical protein [Variibacter gotjawalensis]NIK46646.1 hypothetical protein [Variibacter gotjawalensis]RZS48549.1 hypothetical protein EV661_0964 [Variibacter gotjawalensis]BAT60811.1 hypothetical protein GJW-30_1_03361 [Variibacter gotjawalensis]